MIRRSPGTAAADRALDLMVDALAAYRLTRLATADVISEPMRRSIVRRALGWSAREVGEAAPSAQAVVDDLADPPSVARLITCRWCAGMWIAAGVVGARQLVPSWWDPAAKVLAYSAAAVLIAGFEDD